MTTRDHYDKHLARFYSWMSGEIGERQQEFDRLMSEHRISPAATKVALDLGAGHGVQSVALAKAGFRVTAIDFSETLATELRDNCRGFDVQIVIGDIRNVKAFGASQPELVVCCGDTLTHLDNFDELDRFLTDVCDTVVPGGKLVLTYRNYANENSGTVRFIPVRSDSSRILTCILDFESEKVRVTDLLYEKKDGVWEQSLSSYYKLRVPPEYVTGRIRQAGLGIVHSSEANGMATLIAEKSAR